MNYDLKKFEKEYGKKSINECVSLVKKWDQELIKCGEKLIGLLWYLEKTKRFKEMPAYKKLAFGIFVEEVCAISYNRYRQLAYAYNWYPEACYEYGPQTVQTILQKDIPRSKIPQVIMEIKGSTAKIKDPEKRRQTIHEIIARHVPSKSETKSTDTKAYWRQRAQEFEAKFQEARETIKELYKLNAQLREQLERQKAPIEAFNKVKETFQSLRQ